MSDQPKRHEKSAELIAASNAYYRRFANKILELPDGAPTPDEIHLAELLLSGLTSQSRLEAGKLLTKNTVRADILCQCLKQMSKV